MQTLPRKPVPTSIYIAPRGMSFHGQALKQDELGLPVRPNIGPEEYALIAVLTRIVIETMAYPPVRPYDDESFLPCKLVEDAQQCLGMYGLRIPANPDMQAPGTSLRYYPERSSESPYDVSCAIREVGEISGLMTDRQAVELLVHVMAMTGTGTETHGLLQTLINTMAARMSVAA